MMLQLNPPIPVETPLGEGWAHLVIDYSLDFNSVWVVFLSDSGMIKHFDSNDLPINVIICKDCCQTNRIPLSMASWIPVIVISIFSSVGILQINEK